ncbi:uncharacterized protein STEHIDRAFT_155122 [Stereum hirsutum FP-91666 SS1]|uniref:uncharacterized protein n=1 Tax=Stereum hirsutum (strain FP-91666) TaxID=721885 RepID=UPI000440AE0B|nr:uncharacterized protein STEHIDRAFT_155122 [Stereum hirsutum FP-91666 SS1]EIM87748.1 hypothetical protein STEHIDRAFT_155122 [Stereum hirsutum FP-91666 SS1]
MSAAFTFGSLGDIFSLIQLTYNVVQIIRDAAGAPQEYQELVASLNTTLEVLNLIRGVAFAASVDILTLPVQRALYQATKNYDAIIRDLNDRLSKFQPSLRAGGSKSKVTDFWRKVQWRSFQRKDLVEIRRKMDEQSIASNGILSLLSIGQAQAFIQTTNTSLLEIRRCVEGVPRVLGYAWEGGLNDNERPIVLNDMLGQTIRLPHQLCRTWPEFDEFIRFYFRRRGGREFVERGDYDISSSSSNLTIEPTRWKVSAGDSINMNALLHRLQGTMIIDRCPSCHRDDYRDASTGLNCIILELVLRNVVHDK